jgi:hypothetical protein
MRGTAGRRRTLDKVEFLKIEFPLPPPELQKVIADEIECQQKMIDDARNALDLHLRATLARLWNWATIT